MDASTHLARETLELIEKFYPGFRAQTGMGESTTTRIMFYQIMMEALAEKPLPDTAAHEFVMDKLDDFRRAQLVQLRDRALSAHPGR